MRKTSGVWGQRPHGTIRRKFPPRELVKWWGVHLPWGPMSVCGTAGRITTPKFAERSGLYGACRRTPPACTRRACSERRTRHYLDRTRADARCEMELRRLLTRRHHCAQNRYPEGREAGFGRAPSSLWFRSCTERQSARTPEPQPSSCGVVQVHTTAATEGRRAPGLARSGRQNQSKIPCLSG